MLLQQPSDLTVIVRCPLAVDEKQGTMITKLPSLLCDVTILVVPEYLDAKGNSRCSDSSSKEAIAGGRVYGPWLVVNTATGELHRDAALFVIRVSEHVNTKKVL
jgi:hypothetical protein